MGMTSIIFREGRENIKNLTSFLQTEFSLKAQNTKDTLSYLWTATIPHAKMELNENKEYLTNTFYYLGNTTIKYLQNKLTTTNESLQNRLTSTNQKTLIANATAAAVSALLLSDCRLDLLCLYALSYTIKPSLYLATAGIAAAGYARGSGIPKEELIGNLQQQVKVTFNSCGQSTQEGQGETPSRINQLYQQTTQYGSLVLKEAGQGLRGTMVLFLECGGQPKALLAGMGAAELSLLLADAGYSVSSGLFATALTLSLAATAAMATTIYYNPLPESQHEALACQTIANQSNVKNS